MEDRRRSVTLATVSEQKRRMRNRESGSGARWSLFVTLAGGMGELVDTIASKLPSDGIRLETPVVQLTRHENRNLWIVTTARNERLEADGVVLATPAFRAGEILAFVSSEAAGELKKIAYASTATVSLAYRAEDFPRFPDSFGFVVPAVEQRKIMACTFSSLKYPGRAPGGRMLLRAFVGGSLQPELFQDDDAVMEINVRDELSKLLGVTAQPLFSRIWRYPDSMPQYQVGHLERIKKIEAAVGALSGLALVGSAYHGVGIADCIRTGEEAAEILVNQFRDSV
jgi:oxygen-dependent protoporphyrinogen oxidase